MTDPGKIFVKYNFKGLETTKVDKEFINNLPVRDLVEWRDIFLQDRNMDLYHYTQEIIDKSNYILLMIGGIDYTLN